MNGLRFSTHYIIPTIPDIVSTWGIFQIVNCVANFSDDISRPIKPLGIVATKFREQSGLHKRMKDNILKSGRLFDGKSTSLTQPPLFENFMRENAGTAAGADHAANVSTLKAKYDVNEGPLIGLTKEILDKCNPPKS